MRLLCDEGVERQIVERLRSDGHDVAYVAEMDPGISDDEVLDRANVEGSVLVTPDKDFGELVYRLERSHHGVILLRLFGLSPDEKARTVSVAVNQHTEEILGSFVVIEPGKIRIRHAT